MNKLILIIILSIGINNLAMNQDKQMPAQSPAASNATSDKIKRGAKLLNIGKAKAAAVGASPSGIIEGLKAMRATVQHELSNIAQELDSLNKATSVQQAMEIQDQLLGIKKGIQKIDTKLKTEIESFIDKYKNEKAAFEAEIAELKVKIASITAEMDALTIKMDNLKKERESLLKKLNEKDEEIDSLESRVNDLLNQINGLGQKIQKLEDEIKEKSSEIEQLKKKGMGLESKEKELKEEFEALKEERDQIKLALDEAEQKEDELRAEKEETERALNKVQERNESLEQEKELFEKQLNDLKNQKQKQNKEKVEGEAILNLAIRYYFGHDEGIDYIKAYTYCKEVDRLPTAELFTKAKAWMLIANMLSQPKHLGWKGVHCPQIQNIRNAYNFFKKAADQTANPEIRTLAISRLGNWFYFGEIVPRNFEIAFKYLIQVDNRFVSARAHALNLLGNMYRCGYYVEKDLDQARNHFRESADITTIADGAIHKCAKMGLAKC